MGEDPTLESFRRLVLARGAELYREQLEQSGAQISPELSQLHPNASDLVRAAARLGVKNLSTDTRALYLRDSDAKVPAAMLARQSQSATSDPYRLRDRGA